MTTMERQSSKNPKFEALLSELAVLHDKKGHDYGGDDPMAGFKDFGWQGIIVRIGDKYNRLKTFVNRLFRHGSAELQVREETVRDTLLDLAAYALLAVILLDEERACGAKVVIGADRQR